MNVTILTAMTAMAAAMANPSTPLEEVMQERTWSAQWIAPAAMPQRAESQADLDGAQWIWLGGAEAKGVEAAPGAAFFTQSFLTPQGVEVRRATLSITADDQFVAYLNGQQIAASPAKPDAWREPRVVDLTGKIRPGANLLAVRAENGKSTGAVNAAGLLARLELLMAAEPAKIIVLTGKEWKASPSPAEGWEKDPAVSASWPAARALGRMGMPPWGNLSGARRGAGDAAANSWICYRKEIDLGAKPASATAYIACDSKYWLWVNGKPVVFEGQVKRGPTPQDTYYDTVDLSAHLQAGRNTVGVLVWYWGKHGFSHRSSGRPGLVFELRAGEQTFGSDKTWQAMIHPAYENTGGEQPNYRLPEHNVRFDARKDIGAWYALGFDAGAWPAAAEAGKPPCAPWNRLWTRVIPQWKNSGIRKYEALTVRQAGKSSLHVARLPYNAQITPWLEVEGPAGATIEIRTDHYRGGGENNVRAEYVTREGRQEYESLGWMNGHEVHYLVPEGVKVLALGYRETGFDCEFAGSFACDDAFLNTLYAKCVRTLYITMRDNYMDCPDRERAQWWGDAVNELGEAFYALSPSSALLTKKAILNLAFWQRANKTMHSPVPEGNYGMELPPQMLASVGKYGFWTYYFYSGDATTLAAVYPNVRDYLSIWQLDAEGLVVHRKGEWDWSDWGTNIDAPLMDQAWFCLALEGAANMARLLGKPEHAQEYEAKRQKVAQAANRLFWTGKEYRSPAYKGATDDRGNALMVVAGVVDPARYDAIRQVLAREMHASPYMEKYVLEALYLMNQPQAALDRIHKRFVPFVTSPKSTIPELWQGGTDNHAWSGGPLTMMAQYIAGVRPTAAAWETYEILPQMASLKDVRLVVPSVKGTIDVRIVRQADGVRLTLTSPDKTTALVGLPIEGLTPKTVTVNGKPAWQDGKPVEGAGVRFDKADPSYLRFVAAPGTWEFQAK